MHPPWVVFTKLIPEFAFYTSPFPNISVACVYSVSRAYSYSMHWMQELRTQDDHGSHDGEGEGASPSLTGQEELERRAAASPRLHYPSVLSYSRQDMKKAYYQAFWRAR